MTTTPDFRSEAFLREHIAQTMAFYHPHAIDPAGGFFITTRTTARSTIAATVTW